MDALTDRARQWAATMHGGGVWEGHRHAHDDPPTWVGPAGPFEREQREELEDLVLAPGATRARGAGHRTLEEAPDRFRTCFERDRDRILHASAFRRLAGKTQVFVAPNDHQRTRLTHALEVAQVATSVARSVQVNLALTEAIAIGHDCGHGPGGHASEDAFAPYLDEGYDHAVWGADVVLDELNLCEETLDGVRNHSWSRPRPATPEGEIVSWADRVAYVCHDFEDAVLAGIVVPDDLPEEVAAVCGRTRREQLHTFISALVDSIRATGRVTMPDREADALSVFRRFNYDRIYLRPASRTQASRVIEVLSALVDFYSDHPHRIGSSHEDLTSGSTDAVRSAVTYVGGMTDRYAYQQALSLLDWPPERLPTRVVG